MKLKKVLKIIVIILILIVVIFLVNTIRKTIIISKLQNELKKYTSSNNYSFSKMYNMKDGSTKALKYYKKDKKQAAFITEGTTKTSMYNNGERIDTFKEENGNKTVNLDYSKAMSVGIENNNVLETANLWQTFIYSFLAKIKNVEFNGKACYEISDFLTPYFEYDENNTVHIIEKETGLVVKSTFDNTEVIIEYSFDNVDDSVFVEPDIGEYTLQK